MDIKIAHRLSLHLLQEHGLEEIGWSFKFDRAIKRFGLCNYTNKEISLSKKLCELNDEKEVKDTILHEIAHALVGPKNGHNRVWKAKVLEIGGVAERCFSAKQVSLPKQKFTVICKNCGISQERQKIPWKQRLSACGVCCKVHNNGYYSLKYRLMVVQNF